LNPPLYGQKESQLVNTHMKTTFEMSFEHL